MAGLRTIAESFPAYGDLDNNYKTVAMSLTVKNLNGDSTFLLTFPPLAKSSPATTSPSQPAFRHQGPAPTTTTTSARDFFHSHRPMALWLLMHLPSQMSPLQTRPSGTHRPPLANTRTQRRPDIPREARPLPRSHTPPTTAKHEHHHHLGRTLRSQENPGLQIFPPLACCDNAR